MTPEQEQKVLDAAAVVSGVFPQFDRRLELLEGQMERMADQTQILHDRIGASNSKVDGTVAELKTSIGASNTKMDSAVAELKTNIGELDQKIMLLSEESAEQTSILRKWEEAQKILAEATATFAVPTSQNGRGKVAEENGENGENGNGESDNGENGNGKKEKEKRKLYEAIGRVVAWVWDSAFKNPKRVATTVALTTLLGGGSIMTYLEGCVPLKVSVVPTPTVVAGPSTPPVMGPTQPHRRHRSAAIEAP